MSKIKLQLKYFFQVGKRYQNIQGINTEETAGAWAGHTSGPPQGSTFLLSTLFLQLPRQQWNEQIRGLVFLLSDPRSFRGLKLPGNFQIKTPIHLASGLAFRSVLEHTTAVLMLWFGSKRSYHWNFTWTGRTSLCLSEHSAGNSRSQAQLRQGAQHSSGERRGSTQARGASGIPFTSKLLSFLLLPQPPTPHPFLLSSLL